MLNGKNLNALKLMRLGIDTQQEFVIYMHADCLICKLEGFESYRRVLVSLNHKSITATLNIVKSSILSTDYASLSESAWQELGAQEGDEVYLTHAMQATSLKHIRSKIYGNRLTEKDFDEIIEDILTGKYLNIHISSFVTSCGGNNLDLNEITDLTKVMLRTGAQLKWDYPLILDKHCVGGLPGNRTTPLIVPIIAAAGLIIPKTSSRAITSPAGTTDTVETMTTVDLDIKKIRAVVEAEGGCMVWGGAISLSPSDDIIIQAERSLDLDSEGQMIASVLSKKAAVGATHVVIDIPVGPSAKIRSDETFLRLKKYFLHVGKTLGLEIHILKTAGNQPVGVGIGPALEARDILAILRNEKAAPLDLKQRAINIAAALLELGKKAPIGQGASLATKIIEDGSALKKFMSICQAQGGFKEPSIAAFTYDIIAEQQGRVTYVDNRNLAKIAKLAGAPYSKTAGVEYLTSIGAIIEKGQILYRIHADSKGGLAYALAYAKSVPEVIKIQLDK